MICFSLNSGSNGNCIYVEAEGVSLLFDAGISGRRTADRLAARGRDVRNVDAVVISHDHIDHVRCAGVLARKFALPVYMTRRTHRAARRYGLGPIPDLRFFKAGEAMRVGPVTIEAIRTPHDAADSVAFVVSAGRGRTAAVKGGGDRRLGILTDLGHVFSTLPQLLKSLDAAFLESNYDPDMLATGPYPTPLKQRIAGAGGHISNVEAAELARAAGDGRLQWLALSHLSEVNNTPELAVRTHRAIAGRARRVHVAGRHGPSRILRIE